MEEKYIRLLELVKKLSKPNLSDNNLNTRTEWTAEKSYGNYDDCFQDGSDCSEAYIALECRAVLKDIGE